MSAEDQKVNLVSSDGVTIATGILLVSLVGAGQYH